MSAVLNRRGRKPDVSFVTPVGRLEQFLAEAGDSIRAFATLSGARVEWVVACDGVTPEEIAHLVGSPEKNFGIRVIPGLPGPRTGPARTRNRALAVATAPLLGALDSDDIFLPEGMAALYRRIISTKTQWIAGRMVSVDVDGVPQPDPTVIHLSDRVRTRKDALVTYFEEYGHFPWHSTGTLARTKIIREAGGWDESITFARAEDFALWARVTREHSGLWCDIPVVSYRDNPDSITHTVQWDRFENIVHLLRTRIDDPEPSTGVFAEDLKQNLEQFALEGSAA